MYKDGEKVVLFGTGSGAIKLVGVLQKLNIEIIYCVDNDEKRWGQRFIQWDICNPSRILHDSFAIVIASAYSGEIEKQLYSMGVKDRIYNGEIFKLMCIDRLSVINMNSPLRDQKIDVFMDITTGSAMCGVWTWAERIMQILLDQHVAAKMIGNTYGDKEQYINQNAVQYLDLPYDTYANNIEEIGVLFASHSPCIVVSNFLNEFLYGAIYAKKKLHADIRIISVAHNDEYGLMERHKILEPYLDDILCVSDCIRKKMLSEFHISESKLRYYFFPVKINDYTYIPRVSDKIILGIASRLEVKQKRMDLLKPFIELLDSKNVDYELRIAGFGSYEDKIRELEKNSQNIKFLGRLQKTKMASFWRECDVFVSMSDYEGTSVSMLEAMAEGTAVVTTRVSGTEELVIDGYTGYCVETGNIKNLANRINLLAEDGTMLEKCKINARDLVIKRCNVKQYLDFFQCEIS